MIVALDQLLFGDGHGLKSPFHDDAYYWLVDGSRVRGSGARTGALYTFGYGLGAQLSSFQWTTPRPGERRRLLGRDFVVLNSSRKFLRVRATWALVDLPRDLDAAHAAIRALKADLGKL